jgi:hypothetical protein
VLRGGDSGPAAVPGKPEESLLVHAVRYHDEPRMPPKKRLSNPEIDTLTRWVELGLPWPTSPSMDTSVTALPTNEQNNSSWSIQAAQRAFWSFQPVVDRAPPDVHQRDWPRTPVDRFILASLEAKSLAPAASADQRTLIRRATFDLTGLPPTPDEVDAFLNDARPDAFARVVDRLLASPQYGERWARFWLDLVHYADTAGETADFPVPEAYRYRNYVIDAFNADLPYDQFLREQIAGDVLAAEGSGDRSTERIVATGFLATARRFGFDPQTYHHLTIEDTIDTLGKTVLGLTVACARCHDHKFDPISSADYYALYGIFASTRYPFPGSEETKRPRDFVPLAANSKELAYAMAEGTPVNARIQRRGDPKNLGAEAPRRFLQILGGRETVRSGSGRRELARWLTDPANPLTARVIVNRVWQQHFGRGIVPTPSNFGKQGQPPSHPELLDWLAARFVAQGWSIKSLHRLIMLSQTYQLASAPSARAAERDPDNVWLSHAARRRLDAESIRDAILATSGGLDRTRGGPHPFPPVSAWNFTQHNPFQAVYETDRRSIYLMTQRTRRNPYLALFDGPDPNTSTDRRNVTTVPTQALFFLNNPFVHAQSAKLADRLLRARADEAGRIDFAHRLVLGRPPSAAELAETQSFLRDARAVVAAEPLSPAQREHSAWTSFARVLFSSNEFIYVE